MDWKKLGRKLLFPPVWVMVLLTVVSTAALVTVFAKGWSETAVAYIIYVLAFYTLCVVSVFCVRVLPGKYRSIRERINATALGNRYMTDRNFRARVSMYLSFGINLLYVAINLLSWYLYRSWWFVVLAFYYVILSTMRLLLVQYVRGNDLGSSMIGEWKRARICAAVLLLVNLSLSGAVLMILYQSKGYEYHGIMIYVMAMYTFYTTIHATVDIIKYRKLGSPVMSAAKIVSLCAALVSMLNLETAMFSQFGGEMEAQDQRLMIILTGAGVSVIVVTLSVLLIVRASKEIRGYKNGKQR